MVAAIARFILQIKVHRRLHVDDYFLLLACLCVTAGTVLGYINVGNLYWSEDLSLNPTRLISLLTSTEDLVNRVNAYERLYYTYGALLFAAIFAVKFAYLTFFRQLVARLRPLLIYWRVVLATTIISFLVAIISVYLGCEKWGLEARMQHKFERLDMTNDFCSYMRSTRRLQASLGLSILDMTLDVGTDIMIILIPIRLLWAVRIKPRQKFFLGIFLSLNMFMAITASVRVSGLKFYGTFDEVWMFLWQQIEACVAVAMISLTAFRSVFVASAASRARMEGVQKPWYSSTVEAIKRRRQQQARDKEEMRGLPTIPGATLTGMGTFIQGVHRTTSLNSTSDGDVDDWPLHQQAVSQRAGNI
jgi:hypothetical protein